MSDVERLWQELRTALELEKVIDLTGAMPGKFFVERDDKHFEPCHPGFVALILRIEGESVYVRRLKGSDDVP